MRVLAAVVAAVVASASSPSWASPGSGKLTVIEERPSGSHPFLGPALAPVTIEFFCNLGDGSHSANLHFLLQELAQRHPTRLRILYRLVNRGEHPSPFLEFGQEAAAQGRFFEFLDAYYGPQRRNPRPDRFEEIAEAAGIDYSRVEAARRDSRHEDAIADNYFYAKRRRVDRSPGLLVNGEPVRARVSSIGQLESLYDRAYADALADLGRGIELEALYDYQLARIDAERLPPTLIGGQVDSLEPGEEPPASPKRVPMNGLLDSELVMGPEEAEVTAVFLCHFQSTYCRAMASRLRDVQRAYRKELRLIFQPLFDTRRAGQEHAALLHEAALCAHEQGAFWEYYDELFERIRVRNLDVDYAVERAREIELNSKSFRDCLESGRQRAAVQQQLKAARGAGIVHTPALVIGGTLYSGRLHFEDLVAILDAELAPGILAQWTSEDGR